MALIVFRFDADAGVSMGLGCFSRYLTLAATLLANGARILFLISHRTALQIERLPVEFGFQQP
jgi:spore coat polysaccharide biosynthesis predicted glycosyltransferase SpsG